MCSELDYGVVDGVGGHTECLRDGICPELPDRGMPLESEKVVEEGVPLHPPPVLIDGEPEYEILEILDSKLDNRRHLCKLLYLVRWFGYEGTDDETSWLPTNELAHASDIISDFHVKYPSKPGPIPVQ